VRQIVPRTHERKRLERLRRRPHEARLHRVTCGRDDLAFPNRDGVNPVPGLDNSVPAHLDHDRLRHARSLRPVAATVTEASRTRNPAVSVDTAPFWPWHPGRGMSRQACSTSGRIACGKHVPTTATTSTASIFSAGSPALPRKGNGGAWAFA